MLRSMIIGLAIAALLQVGGVSLGPADNVTMAAQQIDWVQVQSDAVARVLCDGFTLLTR